MSNGLGAGAGPSPRMVGPGGAFCADSAVAASMHVMTVLRICRMGRDYRRALDGAAYPDRGADASAFSSRRVIYCDVCPSLVGPGCAADGCVRRREQPDSLRGSHTQLDADGVGHPE